MIDVHCHLEQEDYDSDRQKVIEQCKKKLKAIITSCAHPKNLDLTLEITEKNKGFVFASVGLHPTYIKELTNEQIDNHISKIREIKDSIVAIGETGLDYHWIKEQEWQEKEKVLFRKILEIVKELNLPVIIHSRSAPDTIDILEQEGMKNKKVLMHLFVDKKNLQRVIDNGWYISIGPNILMSKTTRKIARDMPLNKIMLETDSPWFGFGQRGMPINIIKVAEKIAEIKKISREEIEKQTDLNAINFFNLPIS